MAAMVPFSLMLLFTSSCFAAETKKDQPLNLAVGEVTGCKDHSNLPIRVQDIKLRVDYSTGDMFVNSTVILEMPLDDPIALRFDFYKCLSREVNSCSLQQVFNRETVCDDISKKGMVWSPILESIDGLEPKCPLPKGTYTMLNGPVTKAIRESMPMNEGHWRLIATMRKGGRIVACQRGYGEVKPKRRGKPKGNKG